MRTSILRNETAWTTRTAPSNAFIVLGTRGRRSQSSTSDMAPNGVLFAAQVQLEGLKFVLNLTFYNSVKKQFFNRRELLGYQKAIQHEQHSDDSA